MWSMTLQELLSIINVSCSFTIHIYNYRNQMNQRRRHLMETVVCLYVDKTSHEQTHQI